MLTTLARESTRHKLHCMEIWGGNRAINSALSVPGLDAWVYSRPHNGAEAGGDIHYVSQCGGGYISRFAVADVSGHGQSVDEWACRLRGLMRQHINKVNQTRFIRALNRDFQAASAGDHFATALLTTYFAATDHLIICNAGHPQPLWYQARTGRWQYLHHDMTQRADRVRNLPLGVIVPTAYHQFAVPLEKGDLVLIYTDSLPEARSSHDTMLGPDGLLAIVGGLDTSRPQQLVPDLLSAVTAFSGGRDFDDDVTVVLLHHNAAAPPRQSLGEVIKVVGRMLGLLRV